jgi:hypothetical protein
VRNDAVGFFWDDTPPPRILKTPERRTPPAPTWLSPDYLPGLEEALRFPVHVMSDAELQTAQQRREPLVNDDEVYVNYFVSMFRGLHTGSVVFTEVYGDRGALTETERSKLRWILDNFNTIGFNSINYDMTINALAIEGFDTANLKLASDKLIVEQMRSSEVLRAGRTKRLMCDHVDLIEVAPLFASLKGYAGRLHVPKLQDLPFHPATVLSPQQATIVRWYCVNDTTATAFLNEHLREHIDLRIQFGQQYNEDWRSLSDAQMAEQVIRHEIKKVTGKWPPRPKKGSAVGQVFRYQPPHYVAFQDPQLQEALAEMSSVDIKVGPSGHAECPKAIRERVVTIGGKKYKVGMGGLHSQEKRQAVVSDSTLRIIDRDVTGYYPRLILHNGFGPPQLGAVFFRAFGGMVDRRTAAKREVERLDKINFPKTDPYYKAVKAEADGLKISNNGIFGKTADPFSTVYHVPSMVQITLTGQLCLLMAIEWLELAGIPVISANTDGIVVACPADKYDLLLQVFAAWEQRTGLETEETEYRALYSRDVNNYIAVKMDGKTKTKGAYCERGSAHNSVLSKNPEVLICSDAAQAYLSKGTPVAKTIYECHDVRRFVSVRQVTGGGVKVWSPNHTEFLGKTIRWYYAVDVPGEIVYAKSGKFVPKTKGARPLMELPAGNVVPPDVDYGWYVAFAERILNEVGAVELDVASLEDAS